MSLFCSHCGTQIPKGKRVHDPSECRDELETQRDRNREALAAAEPYDRGAVARHLHVELEHCLRHLGGHARSLAEEMTRVQKRAEAGDYRGSTAGEVQGRALTVDMLCARISTIRDALETLDAADLPPGEVPAR